jgi:hypothetical protein
MWWKLFSILGLAGMGGIAAAAWSSYRQGSREAETALESIAAAAEPASGKFEPQLVAELPEIARRYFNHSVAPGTPLRTTVRLQMEGTFLLGDVARHQSYVMTAQQVLAPPEQFVWIARMRAGAMQVSGSDALVGEGAWTRFWLNGIVPVVNQQGSADLRRSALARAAMEAIWAPASLLPANGVRWEQVGPDRARLHFPTGIKPVEMTLAPDGRVLEVVTQRWSDANADKVFRLQSFGGRMEAEQSFAGFTIPSMVKVGNLYGTAAYLPFFQARITEASFL